MTRARVPASSANLGPGFDTLAVALALYVEVEVDEAEQLAIVSHGEGADLPARAEHLAARVARAVAGHDRFAITVRSDIPVGRGLGSSAALAAATAAAVGAGDPLAFAADSDGHAENAAASVMGGLVTATTVDARPRVTSLPLDDAISFVVLVPDRPLPTALARAALPTEVPHTDAAFNLGRMGLLIGGLGDHRRLVPEATQDRLHQPQRSSLFPESASLLSGLVEAGALASCWSGAGPSLLAVCTAESADVVARAGERLLAAHSVDGRALHLEPDRQGLVLD
ncbi:MAG: homoserine kinase [Actinomycetota bacterium]|nr:homoserine kinase [Actinomycetota bacterium]